MFDSHTLITVNVDIFVCINFRVYEFTKKDSFAGIWIRRFPRFSSLIQYCINIHAVHIFTHFSFTWNSRKYVQRGIIYIYSTVLVIHGGATNTNDVLINHLKPHLQKKKLKYVLYRETKVTCWPNKYTLRNSAGKKNIYI